MNKIIYLSFLLLGSCYKYVYDYGNKNVLDKLKYNLVKEHKTTKGTVIKMFGQPRIIREHSDGELYVYQYDLYENEFFLLGPLAPIMIGMRVINFEFGKDQKVRKKIIQTKGITDIKQASEERGAKIKQVKLRLEEEVR